MLETTRFNRRRLIPAITAFWIVGIALIYLWQTNSLTRIQLFVRAPPLPSQPVPRAYRAPPPPSQPVPRAYRAAVYNLTDFGAVGDGKTVNTEAFERAIAAIKIYEDKGGGQLNVQAGLWLTAPFNLTSCMTLFLEEGAVILAIQVSM